MEVILVLLIASVLVAGGFLVAFLWAIRSEQYDDFDTPAVRMLFDYPSTPPSSENKNASTGEN